MASYKAKVATHQALTANAADAVTLTGRAVAGVLVVNRTGTAEITFLVSVGPDTPAPSAPTALAVDAYVIPASIGSYFFPLAGAFFQLSLIDTAGQAYSVMLV